MKFKDIRDLIYCECCVIVGDKRKYHVNTHEPTEFDELEVIGIRAHDNKWEAYVIISCK